MKPVVDWVQRDKETSISVKYIAENLRNSIQRPKWITRGAIAREGKLSFLLVDTALLMSAEASKVC
jgi:hypothetical protein